MLGIAIGTNAISQDTTLVKRDSVKKIVYSPYYSQSISTSTSYAKMVDSKYLLKLSAGINIFNALRGQALSIFIPAYVANASSVGLRTGYLGSIRDANVIVDGVPFGSAIGNYQNLNAFEYSSIATVNSPNATLFMNGSNSGSFVITSKTGEGYKKPLFEVNSFVTKGWREVSGRGGSTQDNDWYYSNSFAYSQDYGAVDLRVSYNLLNRSSDLQKYIPNQHNLKINAGVNVGKFSARVLVDGSYRIQDITYPASTDFLGRPTPPIHNSYHENFLQSNLALKYQINRWLKLSSQIVFSQRDSLFTRSINQDVASKQVNDNRDLVNFFVNADRKIGLRFGIGAFAGIQFTALKRGELGKQTMAGIRSELSKKSTWSAPHFVYGITTNYLNFVFLEFMQRRATYTWSAIPNDYATPSDYALGTSFIFSKLWSPTFLSFGKIRINTGEFEALPLYGYPAENFSTVLVMAYATKGTEVGLDLSLFKNKVSAAFNYFVKDQSYPASPTIVNVLERRFNIGWEAELRFEIFKKKNTQLEMGLWMTSRQEKYQIRSGSSTTTTNYSRPFRRDGASVSWSWNQLVLSALAESLTINDAITSSSFIKLRDVSLGCNFPKNWIKKMRLKEVFLSLSGRNLYVFESTAVDFEDFYSFNQGFQKSISANLLLSF